MTNTDTTDNIQIGGTEIEKVSDYKYLGYGKQNKARSFDKNKNSMESFLESTEKSFWTGAFP